MTQRNANEQPETADVTVLVQVDLKRFDDGRIKVDDFEQYLEEASAMLLAKFPETVLFRKPQQ